MNWVNYKTERGVSYLRAAPPLFLFPFPLFDTGAEFPNKYSSKAVFSFHSLLRGRQLFVYWRVAFCVLTFKAEMRIWHRKFYLVGLSA